MAYTRVDHRTLTNVAMDREFVRTFTRDIQVYGRQREIKPQRVAKITEWVTKGEFRRDAISIAFYNGAKYSLNGHHRFEAVRQNGIVIHTDIHFYQCQTEEDLIKLYNTFDTPDAARSDEDQFEAYKDLLSSQILKSMSAKTLQRLANALIQHLPQETHPSKRSLNLKVFDKVVILEEQSTYAEQIAAICEQSNTITWIGIKSWIPTVYLSMLRNGIAAETILSFVQAVKEATDSNTPLGFWRWYLLKNGIKIGTRDEAMADPTSVTNSANIKKTPREAYHYAIYCWNAWVNRKTDLSTIQRFSLQSALKDWEIPTRQVW